MARGKKRDGDSSSRKPRPSDGAPIQSDQLTDDQRYALHVQHCSAYEAALAAKKASDKRLKDVGKVIKAEGDSVEKCKQTIRARTPEGEAELRAEMAQTMEVLRWSGVEVGETADLFPQDRTPSVDRAHAEGKRAGLAGEPARPPHDPSTEQYRAWMEGHGEGQAVLARGFKAPAPKSPADDGGEDTDDERDLRPDALRRLDEERATGKPAPIGTVAPTHVTTQ